MSEKKNAGLGSSSQPQENKHKISEHRKSVDISSSKRKNRESSSQKNIEQTGAKHDDWNDPTGNSHVSDKK